MKKLVFILDPGHYPEQPGKRSPVLQDGRQFLEWKANYAIASAITDISAALKNLDVVYPLSQYPKAANNLKTRASLYKQAALSVYPHQTLVVSIHSNAAGDGEKWHVAQGIETYYWHTGSNLSANMQSAFSFQKHLCKAFPNWTDRGVKPTKTLALFKLCSQPVILTETGFYTHSGQVQEMLKPDYITKAADAHYAAMTELQLEHQDGKLY